MPGVDDDGAARAEDSRDPLLLRIAELESDLAWWRQEALNRAVSQGRRDSAEMAALREQVSELMDQLEALKATLSWRATSPLRTLRRRAT